MTNIKNRLHGAAQLPLLCGWLGLMSARAVFGADALYLNTGTVNDYMPLIDATNFVNGTAADPSAVFTYDFSTYGADGDPELYYTLDTLNYTNYGSIIGNNGFDFETISSQSGLTAMAASFYSSGSISSGSASNPYLPVNWDDTPELIVSATNVTMNSDSADVGVDGLLQITGQNVNLYDSTFTMEGGGLGSAQIAGVLGAVGTDTNKDWDPSIDLAPTFAFSSLPDEIVLEDSTPFFDFANGSSNVIIRTAFIEDTSSNVSYSLDFNSPTDLGGGTTTITWVGVYVDPASGNMITNYLYLKDDYLLGAGKNVEVVDEIPDNFTFSESTTPLFTPVPASSGFSNVFFPGVLTNNYYSYVEAQPVSTTESTNGPLGPIAITNLVGRMQITASSELNLNLAQFSGQNYLSLTCTNQYDGNKGATIISPFCDINLGVTNGYLDISNLVPEIPEWSGTIQAWSTRWFIVDTNGVTNDFRVLIVGSQLSPTSVAQVDNLTLHATNSLVISDTLDIANSLFIDAQNLTLTTNGIGVGATSPDGELNLESTGIVWSNSLPNLRNLTNNGAISSLDTVNFGGPSPGNYLSFINSGLVSDQGSQISANNFASGGVFLNGIHSFIVQSVNTTLTNGSITAGGVFSITTSNLLASNVVVSAALSLTIVTANLSDGGVMNGNIWSASGINLPVKPAGDLLGTTITNVAPDNKIVPNTWPGVDRGVSIAGFSNNVALGRLVLDSFASTNPPPRTEFVFNGTGASNALYVDELILADAATNLDSDHNVKALGGNGGGANDNDNVVIYYARAIANGNDVSENLDYKNNSRLRWVPGYAGYFSSTNIVYTNIVSGMTNYSTNMVNAALAQSTDIDSDGDGVVNAQDPTPFFVPGEVKFRLTVTNRPPLTALISWESIPSSTNYVFYRTNLVSANWQVLTNFISPSAVPPVGGWPITNTVSDAVNLLQPRYYQVRVDPNAADLYGGF